jgi:cyclic-di-AMP phosphodiesterase PgpH
MKKLKWNKIGEFHRFKKLLIFLMAFVLSFSILMTSLVSKKYNLSAGDIAKVDIKAPREIQDEAATNEKVAQLEDAVPKQYIKLDIKTSAENNINNFFSRAIQLKGAEEDNREEDKLITELRSIGNFGLMKDEHYLAILDLNIDGLRSYNSFIISVLSQVLMENIEDRPEDIARAKSAVEDRIRSSHYPEILKETAIIIGHSQVRYNLYFDEKATEEMRKSASKNVTPVVIKKDQIIVKEGEPVTEQTILLLGELGLLNDNSAMNLYIYVSLGVLVLIVLVMMWYYLYKYSREIFSDNSKLMLISIINCISLLLARTLSLISPFLIPLACAPMLLTLLLDYKVAIVLSTLNVILISGTIGFNLEITMIALLNGVIGSILLKKMQARNDILYSAVYIALVNVIVTFSTGALLSNNISEVVKKAGISSIGSLIAAVLTIGFLPIFENIFDIITTIKLLELSNPNQPLLKQLLIEAPGTYHHSIIVGNLAEMAAEEVGGNQVLARVGAYYHDVGKIHRPYFFKENQVGNDNPHNKITPNLSALIITSHVKDGIELAKKHKLPKVIRDLIQEHHGTSLVKYFYLTMKNSSERPEEVKEEDFRYPGPIPNSKEAGIIMLADSIEAAVRSISEPTKDKITVMVNNIIKDRLEDGQLDNCDLTLKELNIIKKAFIKSLMGIYHHRIEYPTDKWQEKKIIKAAQSAQQITE